jgi:hypothetical protein
MISSFIIRNLLLYIKIDDLQYFLIKDIYDTKLENKIRNNLKYVEIIFKIVVKEAKPI